MVFGRSAGQFHRHYGRRIVGMPRLDPGCDGFKVTCAAAIYLMPAMILLIGGYLVMYEVVVTSCVLSAGVGAHSLTGVSW